MATFRLEFDAAGEPQLIEEENGSFKSPVDPPPWIETDAPKERQPETRSRAA
jgi:hypothetical protein